MKPQYVVTKGSDDGTFVKGEHIWFEDNGDISSLEAKGWVTVENIPESTAGMEYELDTNGCTTRSIS